MALAIYLLPYYVSERSEETAACGMMEARGVAVERLIEQSLGKDERQSLFLSQGAAPLPRPRPSRADDEREGAHLHQRAL